MTVYVDNIFIQATVPNGRVSHSSRWCHLFSDSLDPTELHEFAARLGLKRSYFQHKPKQPWQDHYDVTEGKRKQAVRLGAVEIDWHDAPEIWMRKREENGNVTS